jgi:hypothetical protein
LALRSFKSIAAASAFLDYMAMQSGRTKASADACQALVCAPFGHRNRRYAAIPSTVARWVVSLACSRVTAHISIGFQIQNSIFIEILRFRDRVQLFCKVRTVETRQRL